MASLRRSASPPPAPNIPQVKIDGVAAEPVAAVSAELPDKAAEYQKEVATADEATLRLQRQLADIEKSEALQRQAALQNRPLTHNEKLASWRTAGMSDGDHDFLASNPDMVLHDRLTAVAAHQAAQEGHARDSDAHRKRTRELFNQHFVRMQSGEPAPQPTAEFPRPSLAPPLPPEPAERTSHFSAPVSRETPTASGQRPSTTRITLTKEEKDMAHIAGISEVEYARQKQRLRDEKEAGNYGEHRYR